MKKINKLFLFLFGLICFGNFVFADIIPGNSHCFLKCVKIENTDSVPGYKLVIRVQTVLGDDYFYDVVEGECLQGHYKFGTSTPILLKSDINVDDLNKDMLDDKKSVEDRLGLETIGIFQDIDVNGGCVSDRSNKTYENDTYRLVVNNSGYELNLINTETDETSVTDIAKITKISLKKIGLHNNYFIQFIQSRLLTIFLETIILFLFCKLFLKDNDLKNGKIILTGILASTITLPILWFVFPLFIYKWTMFVIFGELFVTIVEVVVIKYLLKIKRSKAILSSIVCNLFSALIGFYFM